MTTKRWIAVTLATLACSFLFTEAAQAQTNVVIVDIGKVFKGHPSFTQSLESLKTKADVFKANNIKAQQELVTKAEGIKTFQPGTDAYARAEAELAQESAAMEVESRRMMRDLMLQEARLHYDTYEQVKKIIAQYCDSQKIQLVIRYNSEAMDPTNAQSVMQKVNSYVVYHNKARDITDLIITQLNRQANARPAGRQQ